MLVYRRDPEGIIELSNNHLKKIQRYQANINWLVVLTILKNISQWEGLSHILWKIKKMKPPASQ